MDKTAEDRKELEKNLLEDQLEPSLSPSSSTTNFHKSEEEMRELKYSISTELSWQRPILHTFYLLLDNRINQFERLKSYTNFETRLQFSNAYIIGRLVSMPTYTNFTNQQKDRLHRVLMRTARMTLNSYCFKKSIDYILGRCTWVDIDKMIKSAALKFINNLLLIQKPGELYSKLKVTKGPVHTFHLPIICFLNQVGLNLRFYTEVSPIIISYQLISNIYQRQNSKIR